MAIAFDNSTTANASSVTSLTYAHTVTGSDVTLFVQAYWADSRSLTSITYDGTAMTQVVAPLTLSAERHGLHYLANPTTGSNNVVVTLGGSSSIASNAASYTGTDTASPVGANRTETDDDTSNPYQEALTTNNDNSWVLWATRQYAGGTDSAGTGTAIREDEATIYGIIFADSNAAVSPAGSRTLELSSTASTPHWFSDILVELKAKAGPSPLVADQGGFTLTGQAANFFHNRYLAAAQGSYTLSGQTTGLLANRTITLNHGSFTLTGFDALFQKVFKLIAAQGSYSLSGQDAALTASRILTAGQGSFTLTGQDAALKRVFSLIAGQGTYTLSGQDADLILSRLLTAAQGTFTLTGQDAEIAKKITLSLDHGSFTLTGIDATILLDAWRTVQKSRSHSWVAPENPNTPTDVNWSTTSRRTHGWEAPANNNSPSGSSWTTVDKTR